MLVKLSTTVLVAVAAGLCLAAPALDDHDLSLREAKESPIESYPKCGAPICLRDEAHVGILSEEEVALVNRAADHTLAEVKRDVTVSEESSKRDVLSNQVFQGTAIDCQKRLKCPPGGHPEKINNRCLCRPNKKRDVQVGQTSEVFQGTAIDCQKRLKCPPGGHPEKINNRCLCRPNKLKLERDDDSASLEERTDVDPVTPGTAKCASVLKCPANQHAVDIGKDGSKCQCFDNPTSDDPPRTSCAIVARCPDGQHIVDTAGDGSACGCFLYVPPLGPGKTNCTSIVRCPKAQHPVDIAGDGSKCECYDNPPTSARPPRTNCAQLASCPDNQHIVDIAGDGSACKCFPNIDPDVKDCAAIAKCPGGQQAVFDNEAGQCQCVAQSIKLDCASIAKCAGGKHPVSYNGGCICAA
ncbi:MAG: hypothetical protein L6R36_007159 [Xanthoria steineri]|nr:MAG: hypothetical protein L6R36_007159 [Xanthoria steineri]